MPESGLEVHASWQRQNRAAAAVHRWLDKRTPENRTAAIAALQAVED